MEAAITKAKVTLTGEALTYTVGSRSFRRGIAQILTDPREIAYLRTVQGISVEVLERDKGTEKSAPAKRAVPPTKPVNVEPEGDDDDELAGDDEDEDEPEKPTRSSKKKASSRRGAS